MHDEFWSRFISFSVVNVNREEACGNNFFLLGYQDQVGERETFSSAFCKDVKKDL